MAVSNYDAMKREGQNNPILELYMYITAYAISANTIILIGTKQFIYEMMYW